MVIEAVLMLDNMTELGIMWCDAMCCASLQVKLKISQRRKGCIASNTYHIAPFYMCMCGARDVTFHMRRCHLELSITNVYVPISSSVRPCAMSSVRVGMSIPYTLL